MSITNQVLNNLQHISNKYEVRAMYHEDCFKESGMTDGTNIYLGEISNYQIGVLIFFHELSHILNDRISKQFDIQYSINKTVEEGAAWFRTITLMRENGFEVDTNYNSMEYKYIRKNISTYFETDMNEVLYESIK